MQKHTHFFINIFFVAEIEILSHALPRVCYYYYFIHNRQTVVKNSEMPNCYSIHSLTIVNY